MFAGTSSECGDATGLKLVCDCGRSFSQEGALTKHKRGCSTSKKRLSGVLGKAKAMWTGRKRRRIGEGGPTVESDHPPQPLMPGLAFDSGPAAPPTQPTPEAPPDDSHLTLAERRPWTQRLNRRLPARFSDVLPQPPPPLPPILTSDPSLSDPSSPHPQPGDSTNSNNTSASLLSRVEASGRRALRFVTTARNIFGLSRRYQVEQLPFHDPEEQVSLEDLSNIPKQADPSCDPSKSFYPFPNLTALRMGDWYWNGGTQKSQASFDELVQIIGSSDFRPEDVRTANWNDINRKLAADDEAEWVDEDAGWMRTPVTISVPYQLRRGEPSDPGAGPRNYEVADFYHRSLVSIIREKLSYGMSPDSHLFHYEPYELNWQPPNAEHEVRVQGELYSSPAFIDAHRELQASPPEPGCDLPRVVVALMFWSDSTHLTSFGNAKLWPLYLFFGNESKYRRHKPSCHLCHHVAYFQTLPNAFQDFATEQTAGRRHPSAPLMTHCHREFMHEQWKILLDDDLIEAWKHGIVIECCDGIKRRFYPRIFTYSADYPENIRNLGRCPCPRCLIPLNRVHNLGMPRDMAQRVALARVDDSHRQGKVKAARNLIYKKNRQVNCDAVKAFLQDMSLVPTSNAFSERLSVFGFNVFKILLPDLMHEFDIGGWRMVFIHLMRMLHTVDEGLVAELDRRYRDISTFGRDTIRRFSTNTSEMKKMAARDFEDLLQCAIPVFENLFPEPFNSQVLELLFVMAHWHGLAKMRMHNDLTLDVMDAVTISLGQTLRDFNEKTCSRFDTHELRREYNARMRSEARKAANKEQRTRTRKTTQLLTVASQQPPPSVANHQTGGAESHPSDVPQAPSSADPVENALPSTSGTHSHSSDLPLHLPPPAGSARDTPASTSAPGTSGLRRKTLNLNTYKFHSLGDYPATIRQYGTTDSYSTEPGELEHRSPKARYKRTSRKQFLKQLTQIERRQARIRRIRERFKKGPSVSREDHIADKPDAHHIIGKSQNHPENIPLFLQKHSGDPAVKDFVPRLQDHILPRIKEMLRQEKASNPDASCSPQDLPSTGLSFQNSQTGVSHLERNSVLFKADRMYRHHLARFNYTTYDVRRAQDTINPGTTHRDIMLLAKPNDTESDTDDHPFLYARVLGIFHVNVIYTGEGALDYKSRRVDFLWVRWFGYAAAASVRWDDRKLDPIQFQPTAAENAFGFVDPADVLRSCHIIQSFAGAKVHPDGIGLSRCAADRNDWKKYYVNRFVDRDMIMRYHWGLAIGHTYVGNGGNPRVGSTAAARQLSSSIDDTRISASTGCAAGSSAGPSTATAEAPEPWSEQDNNSDEEDPELELRNREDDILEDEDEMDVDRSEVLGHGHGWEEFSDEEMAGAMDDMYGWSDHFDGYD